MGGTVISAAFQGLNMLICLSQWHM